MLYYELKKIFSRTSSKLLLVLLGFILLFSLFYNIQSTQYVKADGTSISGFSAIRELKESKSKWNGLLTEEQIKKSAADQPRYPRRVSGILSGNNRCRDFQSSLFIESRL